MKEHQHRGLTSAQVEESRRLHGDNLITPRKGDSAWKLFAEKFRDPIIQVLLVAALLSLAMAFIDGEFLETIGIICAIVLATCVGFFFELDAMRRFKRLNLVNDDIPVKVVRDGEMTEVPRRDVVVGDLVYVENGETVPADGKLVKALLFGRRRIPAKAHDPKRCSRTLGIGYFHHITGKQQQICTNKLWYLFVEILFQRRLHYRRR